MSEKGIIEFKGNTRLSDEDFISYRQRLLFENKVNRYYLKFGRMFWNSYKRGTYIKKNEK